MGSSVQPPRHQYAERDSLQPGRVDHIRTFRYPVRKERSVFTQNRNFAPRVGFAWTPDSSWGWLKGMLGEDKTVVRAGAGMYYDNFGPALAMNYDASGTFGLSSESLESVCYVDASQRPSHHRHERNPNQIMPGPPPSAFPVTYPVGAEAIASGIDQSLKTPYSYAVDFSIQRQLPGRMTLDVAYVGHFAHRLLALDDVAAPLNLKDPISGIDYLPQRSKCRSCGAPAPRRAASHLRWSGRRRNTGRIC